MSLTTRALRGPWPLPPVLFPLGAGILTEAALRVAYTGAPVLGQRLCEAHGGLALLALLAVVAARRLHLRRHGRLLGLSASGFTLLHLGYAHTEVFAGAIDGALFLTPSGQVGTALGVLATLGLLPLTLTSTDAARRRLGCHWTALHRVTPTLLLLAAVHAVMTGVHAGSGALAVLIAAAVTAALVSRVTYRKVPS